MSRLPFRFPRFPTFQVPREFIAVGEAESASAISPREQGNGHSRGFHEGSRANSLRQRGEKRAFPAAPGDASLLLGGAFPLDHPAGIGEVSELENGSDGERGIDAEQRVPQSQKLREGERSG